MALGRNKTRVFGEETGPLSVLEHGCFMTERRLTALLTVRSVEVAVMDDEIFFRLSEDFFKSRAVRQLRRIAGGDTYVVIYLRMLIAAARNGGHIRSEIGASAAYEIALELGEVKENIDHVLHILEGLKLVSISDTDIVFKQIAEHEALPE